MEKSKRRPNFTSDEVEILVRGVEKNTKVRMFQGRLLLFPENVRAVFRKLPLSPKNTDPFLQRSGALLLSVRP